MRRGSKIRDPIEYINVRIDMLVKERTKNDNETAHMVIDKCVGELSYVLELLERNKCQTSE